MQEPRAAFAESTFTSLTAFLIDCSRRHFTAFYEIIGSSSPVDILMPNKCHAFAGSSQTCSAISWSILIRRRAVISWSEPEMGRRSSSAATGFLARFEMTCAASPAIISMMLPRAGRSRRDGRQADD